MTDGRTDKVKRASRSVGDSRRPSRVQSRPGARRSPTNNTATTSSRRANRIAETRRCALAAVYSARPSETRGETDNAWLRPLPAAAFVSANQSVSICARATTTTNRFVLLTESGRGC